MTLFAYLRGGGDLASGVALRLQRAGIPVLVAELPQPLVLRRLVSFANAVFEGQTYVEEVLGKRVSDVDEALSVCRGGAIPVIIDPHADQLAVLQTTIGMQTPLILIDGRMTKRPPDLGIEAARFVIGLGPGFTAGKNCHAVVETNRGHTLGRVIWEGSPETDTGIPESVSEHSLGRVLRAPADGLLTAHTQIGEHVEPGQLIAEVAGLPVKAAFRGVLRGLVYSGLPVWEGLKIGDIDPRDDPSFCRLVSDKSLAIGGGVLEAILSRPDLRPILWT